MPQLCRFCVKRTSGLAIKLKLRTLFYRFHRCYGNLLCQESEGTRELVPHIDPVPKINPFSPDISGRTSGVEQI